VGSWPTGEMGRKMDDALLDLRVWAGCAESGQSRKHERINV
jgi:hypothetical protein